MRKGEPGLLFRRNGVRFGAGNGAPGRVRGLRRRVRRYRRVMTYLHCSRVAPRGPPCLRPGGETPRTPAPSRAWRAIQPHLPRDFPACRCAAQRGSGGRPWAPRCAYHASRRSLGFVRCGTKGLGRVGASRREEAPASGGGSPYEERGITPEGLAWDRFPSRPTGAVRPKPHARRVAPLHSTRSHNRAPWPSSSVGIRTSPPCTRASPSRRAPGLRRCEWTPPSTLCWSSSCRRTPP